MAWSTNQRRNLSSASGWTWWTRSSYQRGLPRVRGLVHEGLDDDHLAGEPAALDRSGTREAELRADDVRPLRVDGLAGDAELIPHREVGMDLVAVIGLERQVDGVVDQDLVAGGDARQRRELGLALAGDDDVVPER